MRGPRWMYYINMYAAGRISRSASGPRTHLFVTCSSGRNPFSVLARSRKCVCGAHVLIIVLPPPMGACRAGQRTHPACSGSGRRSAGPAQLWCHEIKSRWVSVFAPHRPVCARACVDDDAIEVVAYTKGDCDLYLYCQVWQLERGEI